VTIDVGTGDGRAVIAVAAREPTTLALGLDANAAAMAEASQRAARAAQKGGLPNAAFILAAAESPPVALKAMAGLVTIRFPWGSLLRGVVGADAAVAAGVAALVAPSGVLELLLAPAGRDGLDGVPTSIERLAAGAGGAFRVHGFEVDEVRVPTTAEIALTGSTWARRLGPGRRDGALSDRSTTLVRLVRR
jgi:16S rRNA (adenine(1408)-N(1))-methyltransferase